MTPGARIAAAIGVLDDWRGGTPAERALLRWSRGARYAGSKDRAAVRDHVFDALRRWRSACVRGGSEGGRGAMIGLLREAGTEPGALMDGNGHAPLPPGPGEAGRTPTTAEARDLPDWFQHVLEEDRPGRLDPIAAALRNRAPLHLRANLLKGDRESAAAALAGEGIETRPVPGVATALEVVAGGRALRGSRAFADGLVEPQDAGSQAVAALVPLAPGMRVLDLCAGGGGKAMGMAARCPGAAVFAWDAAPARMTDLPKRARRLGAEVRVLDQPEDGAPFDAVLCDSPCSGSGTWRRDPEGRWSITPERLAELVRLQGGILDRAASLARRGGVVVHATCSVLRRENEGVVEAFLDRRRGTFERGPSLLREPGPEGDGFGGAVLGRR
ncbi:16S rRNA (cytosine967-C5)-methyltransferase [Hasllibacter halocynthiae]|uniref:16S rRNA (Cytosine967-C5)-methyltransferase n=1 Tax=Hasllibacter halocynthiae TaxID=595589 RepID=A0A2T0X8M8_9RHOB|nr:RsmB/NOP family class I SAM-dependent RNA methyltransferase [Hasllibacter halocynthiae]PRY95265.1 16S rRNA (cytosine967-C5)-methyltransferase [Hasllibacter halocynthiae]